MRLVGRSVDRLFGRLNALDTLDTDRIALCLPSRVAAPPPPISLYTIYKTIHTDSSTSHAHRHNAHTHTHTQAYTKHTSSSTASPATLQTDARRARAVLNAAPVSLPTPSPSAPPLVLASPPPAPSCPACSRASWLALLASRLGSLTVTDLRVVFQKWRGAGVGRARILGIKFAHCWFFYQMREHAPHDPPLV